MWTLCILTNVWKKHMCTLLEVAPALHISSYPPPKKYNKNNNKKVKSSDSHTILRPAMLKETAATWWYDFSKGTTGGGMNATVTYKNSLLPNFLWIRIPTKATALEPPFQHIIASQTWKRAKPRTSARRLKKGVANLDARVISCLREKKPCTFPPWQIWVNYDDFTAMYTLAFLLAGLLFFLSPCLLTAVLSDHNVQLPDLHAQ